MMPGRACANSIRADLNPSLAANHADASLVEPTLAVLVGPDPGLDGMAVACPDLLEHWYCLTEMLNRTEQVTSKPVLREACRMRRNT